MRYFLTALSGLLLLAACREDRTMKLPYQPDAKNCYANVRSVPVLGEAIEKMIAEAQTAAPFQARLKAVLDLRMKSIETYRERPLNDAALKEESAYVCAANDLLVAAFMQELDRVAALPQAERTVTLDSLADSLAAIELNPPWNTYTRPAIAARIAELKTAR